MTITAGKVGGWVGWLTVALAGCATAPGQRLPQDRAERLAGVHVLVLAAEREATGQTPEALALRSSARRHYHVATEALAAGDVARAELALERAEVDAELTVALARRTRWEQEQRELTARAQRLRAAAGSEQVPPGGAWSR